MKQPCQTLLGDVAVNDGESEVEMAQLLMIESRRQSSAHPIGRGGRWLGRGYDAYSCPGSSADEYSNAAGSLGWGRKILPGEDAMQ